MFTYIINKRLQPYAATPSRTTSRPEVHVRSQHPVDGESNFNDAETEKVIPEEEDVYKRQF